MTADRIKKIIVIACSSVFSFAAISQNTNADSLKNLLDKTSVDTVRVFLLYKISDEYSLAAPDTAMQFARQALKLAQEASFKKGEARSLTRIGNILASTGDFPKALETHLTSLEISENIDDQVGIAATYNNIARVYTEQGTDDDYKNAIRYYMKTKEIFELQRDSLNLCIVLLNIGDNYEKMDQLDSALYFQKQAYNIAVRIKDVDYIGAILVNLGYIHFKKGNTDSAFRDFRAGLPYLLAIEDNQSLADTWFSLSKCFEKTGRIDSSIFYAKKSMEFGIKGSYQVAVLNAATLLSKIYESIKKFDSAFEYNKIARAADNSIFDKEKTAQLQRLNFREQIRQQDLEEKRAIEAKERSDTLQMIAIAVFIVTFFIILIILGQKKINPRAVEILGILGLLLVFEFIMIFIHPFIGDITHHTPVYMLIIFVIIAAILGPLHHRLTKWLKEKLANRHKLSQQKSELIAEQHSVIQSEKVLPVSTPESIPIKTNTDPKHDVIVENTTTNIKQVSPSPEDDSIFPVQTTPDK